MKLKKIKYLYSWHINICKKYYLESKINMNKQLNNINCLKLNNKRKNQKKTKKIKSKKI